MDKETMFGLAIQIIILLNPHYSDLKEVEEVFALTKRILGLKEPSCSPAS
jgi:hypothetical protein